MVLRKKTNNKGSKRANIVAAYLGRWEQRRRIGRFLSSLEKWVLLGCFFAVIYVLFPSETASVGAQFQEGAISKETIIAPFTFRVRKDAEVLKREHNEVIPADDIELFRRQIPEIMRLKSSELARRYKDIDVKIDEMQELHRVLMFAKDEFDAAVLLQQVQGGKVDKPEKVQVERHIDRRMKVYFGLLERFAKLRKEVGELRPPVIEVEHRLRLPERTLKQIIDGDIVDVTPKQLRVPEDV